MEKYIKEEVLGSGSFGVVFKARNRITGQTVAIKRIRISDSSDGLEFTALREIKFLTEFKHPCVIDLLETFVHEKALHLVFEYMHTDLEKVIRDTSIFLSPSDIVAYMQMILRGVEFCHKNFIVHRDIKPSNLLISETGQLKLADFGLAKQFGSPSDRWTSNAVTRWYRSPELLYGATKYGPAIDMWSVGCIFAELMRRQPFFPGDTEIQQLTYIFQALGTPNEKIWPDMTSLPNYVPFTEFPGYPLETIFTAASPEALDLLKRMLTYDPNKRITATEALNHPYFKTVQPTPIDKLVLPARPKSSRTSVLAVPTATRQVRKEIEASGDESTKRKLFD